MKKLIVGALLLGTAAIGTTVNASDNDTVGCLDFTEYYEIKKGMTPGQVAAIADTSGRLDNDSTSITWYSSGVEIHIHRTYRSCRVGKTYTFGYTGYVYTSGTMKRPVLAHK